MKKLLVITALLMLAGVAFGQTLKKGGIMSVHNLTITLNPDVTMNQFLDFYNNKYLPETNKHFEGVKFFTLKGDRGENNNGFSVMMYMESMEVRNRYWPEAGKSSDEMSAIMEKLTPINTELSKLGTTTSTYTDWVIQ